MPRSWGHLQNFAIINCYTNERFEVLESPAVTRSLTPSIWVRRIFEFAKSRSVSIWATSSCWTAHQVLSSMTTTIMLVTSDALKVGDSFQASSVPTYVLTTPHCAVDLSVAAGALLMIWVFDVCNRMRSWYVRWNRTPRYSFRCWIAVEQDGAWNVRSVNHLFR